MAQFYKVRMPDGTTYHPADWTAAEPLYSTVELAAGSFPVVTAFSYGDGQSVPGSPGQRGATLADTNLEGEGARLPENEELIAYTLAIEVFMIGDQSAADASGLPASDTPEVSLANMLRLQRDVLVITKIAAVKEYTHSPLSWFPASTGVRYYNSASRTFVSGGAEGSVSSNNGGESVCDKRQFASPLYVKGGETLSVDIRPGPGQVNDLTIDATARIRLRLFLEGYRKRPVS